eukprot:GHVU01221777.1.p1 GENE.GHVU01221777.1~~GHVU01221777.1.p1  ORF type:complete len:109 (-),score=3.99 GHVU01221777.1:232-558(-)
MHACMHACVRACLSVSQPVCVGTSQSVGDSWPVAHHAPTPPLLYIYLYIFVRSFKCSRRPPPFEWLHHVGSSRRNRNHLPEKTTTTYDVVLFVVNCNREEEDDMMLNE